MSSSAPSDTVLVIGGGIAGIQAALDLANAGARVVLVERSPVIGGVMAYLDKNFPTLDCSICIEAPKIGEVIRHPNIEVLTLAEVVGVRGRPGDYEVEILVRPRFVTDACTKCGRCSEVCPVAVPFEVDGGLSLRKAVFLPFPQAEPGTYVIDAEACLNDPPRYMPCDRCLLACEAGAIDFTMAPRVVRRRVAAIIVATGFRLMDPRRLPQYGYGVYPDVLTSLEFERLLNSSGPTGGEISGKWFHQSFLISDFVTPTSQMQVRFVVSDLNGGSIVEAGVDAVSINMLSCENPTNPCPADLTGEGNLNFADISAFLTAYGNQDPIADFEPDGLFNFLDVSAFLTAFGAGCP